MLLDPQQKPSPSGAAGRATLDDLFRRAVQRRPQALALCDPPDRDAVTGGEAHHLSFAEADRMVSALAGRLRRIGLRSDAIVALQLPNTVESVLALLAVLRAGMIAMPVPLLWGQADIASALSRAGASAMIVSGRIGATDHFEQAMAIAAKSFPIRYVLGFGADPPDGIIALDDLFSIDAIDPLPPPDRSRARPPGPGAHVAVVTWDRTGDGLVPVARSHSELITGGLAVALESRLPQHARILTSIATGSFAGLAAGVVPWLLSGGLLALHHPFDADAFRTQCRSLAISAAIVPGPLAPDFADACDFGRETRLNNLIALWRAPERLPRAPAWRHPGIQLTDVQVFGEIGLIPARRGTSGRPAGVTFGPVVSPRGAKKGVVVAEVRATAKGTIAIRGPMVPRTAFPAGVERTAMPHLKVGSGGLVDTGYSCWSDAGQSPMLVTSAPPGLIGVGGYRFVMRDLQDAIAAADADATLAALPDTLLGHRLAGSSVDAGDTRAALAACGLNALTIEAFNDPA